MDPLEDVDNIDNVTEVSDYSDYKTWPTYCEEEELEALDDVVEEIEKQKEMDKESEKIDIFEIVTMQVRDKRAERIAAQAEETKEKLRELIGMKKERDVSEETLITPEEKSLRSMTSSTESSIHPCLVDIDVSDSQLKLQNLYTMYPIPDDPGLVPAFWNIRESPASYPDDGVAKLNDFIKVSKIQPIKALDDMLLSSEINLQYYGVDPRIIRPLCEALMENTTVQTINLTENWLSEDACYHLNDLLLRNSFVNTLLLSGCRIGAKGVERLQDGISDNTTLIKLDLSKCNIGAEGLDYVATAVCNSSSLESLSLNDNHLDESCVDALQKLVSCSETLKQLELSWNSLYTAGTWRKLGKGIENSVALVDLDLSWNALGRECVPYLRQLLMRSPALTKLNLSGNRFYDEDAVVIARGLTRNKVLEELYLGNNPLKVEGAFALVHAVTPQRSPESQLRVLDLTNIWANKNILKELIAIENGRPGLKVELGGILGNYEIRGPDVKALLFRRANFEALRPKKKRRRRNFGHFVLSLADGLISRAKFIESVNRFRLKLSKTLVDAIMNEFSGARNTVDQELLKSVYLSLYPDTKLPPERPKKKKKAKGEGLKRKKKVKEKS